MSQSPPKSDANARPAATQPRALPIIGIAQTGSDLSPCNRHHLELAQRVRDGIRDAGGIAFEFPVHPIQETGKRPTAALDRNLAYLGLVEVLYGYPLDGVVLMTGCDKTTPACLMAAATVNTPAIVLSGGPMLNGWHMDGKRTGSGTIVWKARQAAGRRQDRLRGVHDIVAVLGAVGRPLQHHGHRLDHERAGRGARHVAARLRRDPGALSRARPDRLRDRRARIVEMVREDLKPSDILTAKGVRERDRRCSAIGGSTNAPIHINAIARHIGVELSIEDWARIGYDVPLLVNMQPAGFYLGEEYSPRRRRAGGGARIDEGRRIHGDALTINGKTMGENVPRRAKSPMAT
jgi:dihydroxy-acid dehydratase